MKQIFALKDRHLLVTGATSGIGRHVAQTLTDAGAAVTVAGRRKEQMQRTVSMIETAGGRAQGVTLDVKDPAQIERALADTERFFGPLHGVDPNVGILGVQAALQQPSQTGMTRSVRTSRARGWCSRGSRRGWYGTASRAPS